MNIDVKEILKSFKELFREFVSTISGALIILNLYYVFYGYCDTYGENLIDLANYISSNLLIVFIAMCNRVGVEHKIDFSGGSVVIDPNGAVAARAEDREQILYADIDFSDISKIREMRSYLKLRRPELCKLGLLNYFPILAWKPPLKSRQRNEMSYFVFPSNSSTASTAFWGSFV